MKPSPPAVPASQAVRWLWLVFMVFVVYGSLVPLDFRPMPLDQAWAAFTRIRFLQLGLESRADWVANGVLYVPVGFLTACLLVSSRYRSVRGIGLVCAWMFSAALALGVEFTQVFFPPRTVSLNDLFAECVGSAVGVVLAAKYGRWFGGMMDSFLDATPQVLVRLLEAYAVVYLLGSLFPYDFLLSQSELLGKIRSKNWGWLLASDSPRLVIVVLQFLLEALLTTPFAVLLIRLAGQRSVGYKQAALAGLALGVVIETAQFFVATGVSQGVSVLSRVLGVWLGLALYHRRAEWPAKRVARLLASLLPLVLPIYLLALMAVNGLFALRWQGLEAAASQWRQLHFMPFYYHYFTTEAKAVFSLVSVCLTYAPIGVLAWATGRSARVALVVAAMLATAIETSKLFLQGAHPDPTNILEAGFTAWLVAQTIGRLAGGASGPINREGAGSAPRIEPTPTGAGLAESFPVWLVFPLTGVALWLLAFPVMQALLALLLAASAWAVWRKPIVVFALVPVALPLLDLAPWSGRFFLDEFDALVMVCLALGFARTPGVAAKRGRRDMAWLLAVGMLGLSFAISAALGLLPLQIPDSNAFNNYFSPYNSLRIMKGAVWAWAFCLLASRLLDRGEDVRPSFAWGMTGGLAITAAVVVWERAAFSKLFDFSDGYRVTGPFSAMHVGGAYIECFLVVATPFLLQLLSARKSPVFRLGALALLIAGTYALMVTFSRNGYAAFAVAVVAALGGSLFQPGGIRTRIILVGSLLGALLLVAVPIFKGNFAQARMAAIDVDLKIRSDHWADALSLRDAGFASHMFGMGLGVYPVANYWRGTQLPRPGTYMLSRDEGNDYLRLGSGNAIYVEQLVPVRANRTYLLKFDVRPHVGNATLTVPICEKWMLTSRRCLWQSVDLGEKYGTWRSVELKVDGKDLAQVPWYAGQTVKLSLFYPTPQSTIDIDNVQLLDDDRRNLVENGGFSSGLDHWFYAADSHLQWHVKSLYVGVLFDQGWFGLFALAAVVGLALARAGRATMSGDASQATMLSALLGFMVVGVFDTLIDAPRFLWLLLVLVWMCANAAPSSVRKVDAGLKLLHT